MKSPLLDELGLRPWSATCAAILGVLVGAGTLIGSVLAGAILSAPAGTGRFALLAWSVVLAQVVAAVLLIVGGVRLAIGGGRSALVTGAALELWVYTGYLFHALAVVARDAGEPPGAAVVFVVIPVVVAAAAASSLFLAMRPITAEYLLLSRRVPSWAASISQTTSGGRVAGVGLRGRYGGKVDAPLWAFLFDLPPFRRVVRTAVADALAIQSRAAHEVIEKLRIKHQSDLKRSNEHLAASHLVQSKLQRQVDELKAATSLLREASARDQARISLLRQELRDSEQRRAELEDSEPEEDERATTDLFVCMGCRSIWELRTRPSGVCSVHKPLGNGCAGCGDRTLDRLWACKTRVADSGENRPASPLDEPVPRVIPDSPEDSALLLRLVPKFVADVAEGGSDLAVAKTLTREGGEYTRTVLWPAERCRVLSAIANGLSPIPPTISSGIRWFATDIVGVPVLVAKTIAEIATRVLVQPFPLKELAIAIRVVGALSCAADNQLADCRCLRDLLTKDVMEPRLTRIIEGLLRKTIDIPGDSVLDTTTPRVAVLDGPEVTSMTVVEPPVPALPPPVPDPPHPRDAGPSAGPW